MESNKYYLYNFELNITLDSRGYKVPNDSIYSPDFKFFTNEQEAIELRDKLQIQYVYTTFHILEHKV